MFLKSIFTKKKGKNIINHFKKNLLETNSKFAPETKLVGGWVSSGLPDFPQPTTWPSTNVSDKARKPISFLFFYINNGKTFWGVPIFVVLCWGYLHPNTPPKKKGLWVDF